MVGATCRKGEQPGSVTIETAELYCSPFALVVPKSFPAATSASPRQGFLGDFFLTGKELGDPELSDKF